jgi:hypothetical protein
MRRLLLRLLLPVAALLALESAMRLGLWDPLLEPQSFAGMTSRRLREVDAYPGKIDFATIGNSRPEYGLSHAMIAAKAKRLGYTHANLTLKGTHWLTIAEESRWLHQHRPEIRNVVIGMGAIDMMWGDLGSYELSLVEPMRISLVPSYDRRQRFDANNLGTYAVWSSLFAHRQDLRWFIVQPGFRLGATAQADRYPGVSMFESMDVPFDTCSMPTDTLSNCAAHQPIVEGEQRIVRQCAAALAETSYEPDWRMYASGDLPPARQAVLDLRRRQVRELGWPRPIIILMPMVHLWRREVVSKGFEAWALRILQPMADAGEITLIDATGFFDRDGITRCDAFWDIHHQNSRGANELTEALLPQIEAALYQTPNPD